MLRDEMKRFVYPTNLRLSVYSPSAHAHSYYTQRKRNNDTTNVMRLDHHLWPVKAAHPHRPLPAVGHREKEKGKKEKKGKKIKK